MEEPTDPKIRLWIAVGYDNASKCCMVLNLSEVSYRDALDNYDKAESGNEKYVVEAFNIIKPPSIFAKEILSWFMSEGASQDGALTMAGGIIEEMKRLTNAAAEERKRRKRENNNECEETCSGK